MTCLKINKKNIVLNFDKKTMIKKKKILYKIIFLTQLV